MGSDNARLNIKTPVPNTFGLKFLTELAGRVWVTEFNRGRASDFLRLQRDNKFCEDRVFTLNSEDVSFTLPDPQEEDFLIWPYRCSPVRLIYDHVTKDTKDETFIVLEMVYFPGVERVLPTIFKILDKNQLGKYKITEQRHMDITNKLLSAGEIFRGISLRKLARMLNTYPELERMYWDDIPVVKPDASIKLRKVLKKRVLLLSWNGELDTRREGYVTYKLTVPENYFQPW